jgi:glycosyltransferase involved in cell wall biosynthesis
VQEGENGLLVDPADPQALADAILMALEDRGLRERAKAVNLTQIMKRADYPHVMAQAEFFYRRLLR